MIKYLVLLTVYICTVSSVPAGIASAVDVNLIQSIKDYFLPVIQSQVKDMNLGTFEQKRIKVTNIRVNLNLVKESINIGFSGA